MSIGYLRLGEFGANLGMWVKPSVCVGSIFRGIKL